MADNKRWFKIWVNLLVDMITQEISLQDIGRFTILGLLVTSKGNKGKLMITQEMKKTFLKCENLDEKFLHDFNIKIIQNDNGKKIVSFKNWWKYQKDSTAYERLKKWRKNKDETLNETVKLYADKTKTKTKTKKKNISDSEFINLLKENPAYKGIDIDIELGKMDAWFLIPKNKNRKKTRGFILNWLNKIEKPMELVVPVSTVKPHIAQPREEIAPEDQVNPEDIKKFKSNLSGIGSSFKNLKVDIEEEGKNLKHEPTEAEIKKINKLKEQQEHIKAIGKLNEP